jgi:N-acetylmuramic acid 6-phosphate (MurNAc-6-P) etherase
MTMERKRSLTETPNPITADIDLAEPIGIVRLLRQTDAQIFAGYGTHPGFYDRPVIEAMGQVSRRVVEFLKSPHSLIVLSGAGTSGRLAMFLAREFNAAFAPLGLQPFRFLIAGGPPALIQALEGAEDDPYCAQRDLAEVAGKVERVMYFGITCGFSAPYIAGQLEYALERPMWHAVLVGFNPLELARTTPIEGWPAPFKATAEKVAAARNGSILNPIVGPEPITGSTRMKSGTATKIVIELVFSAAREILTGKITNDELDDYFVNSLKVYEQACRTTYLACEQIAQAVEAGGEALRRRRYIYYLGGAGRSIDPAAAGAQPVDAGILGLIDASECPPTFGAGFEDVRGFVERGWQCLFPAGTVDLSARGAHFRISIDDFRQLKLAELAAHDLCVFIGWPEGAETLLEDIRRRGARTACISWDSTPVTTDICIGFPIAPDQHLGVAPIEMAVKLVLNAITTGAHVLAGKVFGNRMVDLRISNNKLFHRTVSIITDLIGVSAEEAHEALLKAVFQTDELTEAEREAPISACIEAARDVEKVVPKALLIATGRFTYQAATEALKRNPIVRSVISEFVR